jgi:uncharacterized protein YcnI
MKFLVKAAVLFSILLVIPSIASAHAVVFPKKSTHGAYEKYVLRVPNEKDVATNRVEIRFPAGLRVVSFGEVAGWQLEELRDSSNAVIGAVWTGNLPAERFVEFPFVAVNPKEDATLVWPAFQTYANGERVDWTGPADGEKPASSTTIGNAADSYGSRLYLAVSGVALLLSLMCLGLTLRKAS